MAGFGADRSSRSRLLRRRQVLSERIPSFSLLEMGERAGGPHQALLAKTSLGSSPTI